MRAKRRRRTVSLTAAAATCTYSSTNPVRATTFQVSLRTHAQNVSRQPQQLAIEIMKLTSRVNSALMDGI